MARRAVPGGLRITLVRVDSTYPSIAPPTPSRIGADGTFSLASVPPGRYVVNMTSRQDTWQILSALSDGVDLADVPIEMNGQQISGVVVQLGNRPATFSGEVTLAAGEPARDAWVIVFSTDRTWRPSSRRVSGTQITADGRYTAPAMPPGEYYVVALADVDPGRWYDAAFLQQLLSASPMKTRCRRASGRYSRS